MSLPEALHLFLDGDVLAVCDAQLLPQVTFTTACGDPCEWSHTIVTKTCAALDIIAAWINEEDDATESTVAATIDAWHAALGADDGFLP